MCIKGHIIGVRLTGLGGSKETTVKATITLSLRGEGKNVPWIGRRLKSPTVIRLVWDARAARIV